MSARIALFGAVLVVLMVAVTGHLLMAHPQADDPGPLHAVDPGDRGDVSRPIAAAPLPVVSNRPRRAAKAAAMSPDEVPEPVVEEGVDAAAARVDEDGAEGEAEATPARVQLRSLATGEPIRFAPVELSSPHVDDVVSTRTDGEGFVSVPERVDSFTRFSTPGHEQTTRRSPPGVLFLAPSFALRVEAGRIPAGAHLTCRPLVHVGTRYRTPHPDYAAFDMDGVATLDGLPADIPLVVGVARHGRSRALPIGAGTCRIVRGVAGAVERVSIDLDDTGRIDGVITNLPLITRKDGRVLSPRVLLEWRGGGGATEIASCTPRAGRFSFERVMCGEYVVRVEHCCAYSFPHRSSGQVVRVTRGATTTVALDEALAFAPVEGIVLNAAGNPVRAARVGMWGHDGFGGWVKLGRSGADGRFRTPPLPLVEQRLFVWGFDEQTVRPGEFVTFRAEPSVLMQGRLIGVAGDATATGHAMRSDGGYARLSFDGDRFEVRLQPGTHVLHVLAGDRVGVLRDVRIRAGEAPRLTIRLERAGKLVLRCGATTRREIEIAPAGYPHASIREELSAYPWAIALPPGQYEVRDRKTKRVLASCSITAGAYSICRW